MSQGFVALRRGLLEHLESGKMSPTAAASYMVLLLKADRRTGCWQGSASRLAACFGKRQMPERTARKIMTDLETAGYIKRFQSGHNYVYPILINKYEVRTPAASVQYVNAEKTKDIDRIVYDSGGPAGTSASQQEGQYNNLLAFDSPELKIKQAIDAILAEEFPWVDRQAEYRAMQMWVMEGHRSQIKYPGQFARNWFKKIPKPAEEQEDCGIAWPDAERQF